MLRRRLTEYPKAALARRTRIHANVYNVRLLYLTSTPALQVTTGGSPLKFHHHRPFELKYNKEIMNASHY